MEGDKNSNFCGMSPRLVEALKLERNAASERVGLLDRILN
jgi:hypothetical protein